MCCVTEKCGQCFKAKVSECSASASTPALVTVSEEYLNGAATSIPVTDVHTAIVSVSEECPTNNVTKPIRFFSKIVNLLELCNFVLASQWICMYYSQRMLENVVLRARDGH